MSDDVSVKFGADISELTAKLGEVNSKLKESIGGIQESFAKVQGAMIALSAVLAGGEAFKEAIEKTIELSSEANKLAHTFGITATEAGTLAVALDDIHSSTEQYLGVSQRLMRQVKSNEHGLNDFGLSTRDASGAMKSQQQLMMDSISILNTYSEGTSRTQAAMKLFGGRVGDITQLLLLNNDVMEAAKKKEEELGLTVTPNNIRAMMKYKDMLNDVHDVFNALQKVVGDVVIPRLTEMGNWFAEIGPQVVRVMTEAMRTYVTAMDTVGAIVRTIWSVITQAFHSIGMAIDAVFGTGGSGVTAMEFIINLFKIVEVAVIGFLVAFEIAFDLINNVLLKSMSWINRFASIAQAALHMDWNGIKTAWKEGSHEIDDINQKTLDDMVASSEKAKTDIDNVLMRPAGTTATQTGAGEEPTKAGNREMVDEAAIKRQEETVAREAKMATTRMDLEKEHTRFLFESGQIDAEQRIAMETKTANAIYEIERNKLEKLAMLNRNRHDDHEKTLDEIKLLEEKHKVDVQKQNDDAALAAGKTWRDYFKSFHDSIDRALTEMIMGTKSFMDAVNAIGKQMLTELVSIGVKAATNWIVTETTKAAASSSIKAGMMTQDQMLAAQESGLHTTVAAHEISTDAVVAGAGATAQSAPYSGWGSIAIGAGVMAAVLAMTGNLKSSAGGEWRVASDRLNMVHKDETILPANIATPLRESMEGGGLGGGGMTVNISAIDAKGVKQFMDAHGSSIADSLMKQKRGFKGGF